MMHQEIQVIPIVGFPIVEKGDDFSTLLRSTMKKNNLIFLEGDILVVSHTIVSIIEGRVYTLSDVVPSKKAKQIAMKHDHSDKHVEVALQEASEVVREEPILVTRTRLGIITDFSGVDESNAPQGTLIALPKDSDATASKICDTVSKEAGFKIPVIISDTQGRPWRRGAVNLALGVAGMAPFIVNKGRMDIHGKALKSSLVCLADEIAACAELVIGQADEKIPIAIVRGIKFEMGTGSAEEILRPDSESLFR